MTSSTAPTGDEVRGPAEEALQVDFYFDPVCPWAWITSRWMLQVAEVRPVQIRWHVMSLAVLNEDKELPAKYADLMVQAVRPVRSVVAAEELVGPSAVLPLYTALGERIHLREQLADPELITSAVAEVGLPDAVAAAADDPEWDAKVRASHFAGMTPVGQDVGTPVIHIGDVALFGPVVSPAPQGEAAGRLFDGVVLCARTPGFFELKRGRDVGPIFE